MRVLSSTRPVSYEDYVQAVTAAVYPKRQLAWSLPPALMKFVGELKTALAPVLESGKIALTELLSLLKSRDLFEALKHFKFSLVAALKAIASAAKLIQAGLRTLLSDLSDTKVLTALRDGSLAVDDFLGRYPVVKRLTGVAMAGFLLWMWLNMSFTGDANTDLDLSSIGDALRGQYTLHDLLGTPEGLTNLALLLTGTTLGLSFPWLAGSLANLGLAMVFTAAKHLKKTSAATAIRQWLHLSAKTAAA